MPFYDRTKILIGENGFEKIKQSKVCIFGLGGVGAAAAMDLVRIGIGQIYAVDFDEISDSNLNRLYFGYSNNVGKMKTEVFTEYAKLINPEIKIITISSVVHGNDAVQNIPSSYDFYVDCIDTLNPKVNLLSSLARLKLPFISSMGTAGKLMPEQLKIDSIWNTHTDTLSGSVRKRLRKLGFSSPNEVMAFPGKIGVSMPESFPCVWSSEVPVKPAMPENGLIPGTSIDGIRVRAVQGSGPFVPQTAGHIIASYVCRKILEK